MNRSRSRLVVSLSAAICLSVQPRAASSQDDDWERVEGRGSLTAAIAFENAPTLAVTCSEGQLVLLMGGLVPAPAENLHRAAWIIRGERTYRAGWMVAAPDEVVSGAPALLTRALRLGGPISIRVPDIVQPEPQPDRRRNRQPVEPPPPPATQYNLQLPIDSRVIAEVMESCGVPPEDPRDDIPLIDMPNLEWGRMPNSPFPSHAGKAGVAFVSCITAERGRLADCEIDAEFPKDAEVGRSVLQAMRGARLSTTDGAAIPVGRMMRTSMAFACGSC